MADNLIITKKLNPDLGEISGLTYDPVHTWKIRFGPMGHCYLHVDEEYVHHGTLLTCAQYLSGLNTPAATATPTPDPEVKRKAQKRKGD